MALNAVKVFWLCDRWQRWEQARVQRVLRKPYIADQTSALLAQANKTDEAVLVNTFDLEAIVAQRAIWWLFRDLRPEMYTALGTSDGKTRR